MKKHLLYLLFQIKSALRTIPRIIICTVVLAVIVLAIGFCGNKFMNTDSKSINAEVAVVLPPNDVELLFAFNIYASMDSMKEITSFTVLNDKQQALDLLAAGKVAAIADIPDGFIASILDKNHTPAIGSIIVPQNSGIESMMFCSVINAGVKTLAYNQAAIYSIADIVWNNNLGEDVYKLTNDYLNDVMIKYAMTRSAFYDNITISSTGEISLVDYYLASVFVLLIILCGLSITGIFSSESPAVMNSMKINRISKSYIRICQYLSASVIFTLLFLTLAFVFNFIKAFKFHMDFGDALIFILLVFSITAFIMFMCVIADNGLVSTLLIFVSGMGMLYACGRILPSIYLPKLAATIGEYLPMNHWCSLFESMGTAIINTTALLYTFCYGIFFIIASLIVTAFRWRDR